MLIFTGYGICFPTQQNVILYVKHPEYAACSNEYDGINKHYLLPWEAQPLRKHWAKKNGTSSCGGSGQARPGTESNGVTALCYGIPSPPVATLWFVASVPSSYLAGVIACRDDDSLAPSSRRHPASKQATTSRSNYIFSPSIRQEPCVSDLVSKAKSTPAYAVVGP